jgi:hypothetical protein
MTSKIKNLKIIVILIKKPTLAVENALMMPGVILKSRMQSSVKRQITSSSAGHKDL